MTQTINEGDTIKITLQGEWESPDGVELREGVFTYRDMDVDIVPADSDTVTVELVSRKKPDNLVPVGTRVRVKYAAYFSEGHGKTGVIEKHVHWDSGDKGVHRYRVRLDDSGGKWAGQTMYVRDVEPLPEDKPEPKFKVGDRVRFKTNRYETEHRRSGTGTIYRIGNNAYHGVAIDGHGPDFGYWESELEHAPSQEFKLRPGDKIRNTKTGRVGKVHDNRCVYDPNVSALTSALTRVPAAAIEEYEEHHPGTYEIIEREGQPF